jgi:hypothetical protein
MDSSAGNPISNILAKWQIFLSLGCWSTHMDFRRPLQTVTPTLDGEVLSVLAHGEVEMTGREIQRMAGHGSHQGIRNAADRLVAQGVLRRRTAGSAHLYMLNRDHLAAAWIEGLAGKCEESTITGRLRKAEHLMQAAAALREIDELQEDVGDAVVTLCVHAGVAAADVICCVALGKYAQGEDHNAAVAHLSKVRPNGRELGNSLRTLLGMKTRAGYSHEQIRAAELTRALRAAQGLLNAAHEWQIGASRFRHHIEIRARDLIPVGLRGR